MDKFSWFVTGVVAGVVVLKVIQIVGISGIHADVKPK